MKLSKKITSVIAVIALISLAYQVIAHDAWVEPGRGPVYRILFGHKAPEPYPVKKVTSLKVIDADQHELNFISLPSKDGLSVKVKQGLPAIFVLDFDNGYWVNAGGVMKNVRHSKMPSGTDPVHPYKYSKTIISWKKWMTKSFGQRIEFLPVNFDGVPKAGSKLRMKLLFDGKPLAGQMVENNSSEKGPKTDADGMVEVTVLKGINRFATDYDIKQDDPDAKRLSLTAALVFLAK